MEIAPLPFSSVTLRFLVAMLSYFMLLVIYIRCHMKLYPHIPIIFSLINTYYLLINEFTAVMARNTSYKSGSHLIYGQL